jgi:cephalosporin-C deacetylase-like acetyl esterase
MFAKCEAVRVWLHNKADVRRLQEDYWNSSVLNIELFTARQKLERNVDLTDKFTCYLSSFQSLKGQATSVIKLNFSRWIL